MAKLPEILYHYTTQSALLSLLKSQRIWATNILFLNDSKEFNHTIQLALDYLSSNESVIGQDLHETVEHLFSDSQAPDVYVTSLTKMRDQLSQWRAYCPNLGGFNIGFETTKLVELVKAQGIELIQCDYDIDEQKKVVKNSIDITCGYFNKKADANYNSEGKFDIDSFLELAGSTRLKYGLQLLLIAPYFKHPKFSEENEFRLIFYQKKNHEKEIFFREGASTIIPYVEIDLTLPTKGHLPIKEIVIGPTPNQELSKKSIEKLIGKYRIRHCDVIPSEIPYRAW
ncbi:MAG: DUF2971 domain-containing protein [Deltaproteobacteria bacterium]|nr:DUF2971 domain-containing protein [Deltaproteobacteria bacterium]